MSGFSIKNIWFVGRKEGKRGKEKEERGREMEKKKKDLKGSEGGRE